MTHGELRMLADHMGHNLNVHMDHYSLQSNLLERAKVANILTSFNNGNFAASETPKRIEDIKLGAADMYDAEGRKTF